MRRSTSGLKQTWVINTLRKCQSLEIPDKSEGLKIRCKPENATDSNQLQFPAAELQQDSRPATKEVTSKQPDKYGDKHNEETALDLRVSRSSSSTIRSCSPSEDDYVTLPSGTNKHSRISRRHSKHGRQSQRVEPQARISSTEKKFHRRPGLRPARSRRHRVHTDVTNLSTSDNVSFIPSRRSRRNRMCVDDDNSHAGFDYTSQLNIRAPFGQNDSCIQTCSTCNIEFKDAVSFVKHIQQVSNQTGITALSRKPPV
ncbi:hypothetical protein AHF37_07928 [Paragonimus kellicotti]|nr:hypothetical protein AHF37_07928 [Paragonimus kellicotti]